MFYIRMNLRMLQQQNEQNGVVILVILWSLSLVLALHLYLSPNNHEYPMVYMKLCTLLAGAYINTNKDQNKTICIIGNIQQIFEG